MALAYVLVTFAVYIVAMLVLLARYALLLLFLNCLFSILTCTFTITFRSLRAIMLRDQDDDGTVKTDGVKFGALIWGSYDYSAHNEKALAGMRLAISGALKTQLTAEYIKQKRQELMSTSQKIVKWLKRLAVNLAVLALLGLEAFLIYFFIQNPQISIVTIPYTEYALVSFFDVFLC